MTFTEPMERTGRTSRTSDLAWRSRSRRTYSSATEFRAFAGVLADGRRGAGHQRRTAGLSRSGLDALSVRRPGSSAPRVSSGSWSRRTDRCVRRSPSSSSETELAALVATRSTPRPVTFCCMVAAREPDGLDRPRADSPRCGQPDGHEELSLPVGGRLPGVRRKPTVASRLPTIRSPPRVDVDEMREDPDDAVSKAVRPGPEREGARVGQRQDPRSGGPAAGVRDTRHLRRGGRRAASGGSSRLFATGRLPTPGLPSASIASSRSSRTSRTSARSSRSRRPRPVLDPLTGSPSRVEDDQLERARCRCQAGGSAGWSHRGGATVVTDDLFAEERADRRRRAPLAARMRPRTLDEVVGQQHLLRNGRRSASIVESGRPVSMILGVLPEPARRRWLGSLPKATRCDVRGAVGDSSPASRTFGRYWRRPPIASRKARGGTVLFLDEIHRFNKSQQDAAAPVSRHGTVILVGATTENPFFEVNSPLDQQRHRCSVPSRSDPDAVGTVLASARWRTRCGVWAASGSDLERSR